MTDEKGTYHRLKQDLIVAGCNEFQQCCGNRKCTANSGGESGVTSRGNECCDATEGTVQRMTIPQLVLQVNYTDLGYHVFEPMSEVFSRNQCTRDETR